MELFSLRLRAYKRFKRLEQLRTNGKLIAIIGPNEAGKSSILQALKHLGHDRGASPDELSRGLPQDSFLVEGKFLLNDEELQSAQLTGPRWLVVQKTFSGPRSYAIEPPAPEKDVSHRTRLSALLLEAFRDRELSDAADNLDGELLDKVSAWLGQLEGSGEVAEVDVVDNLQVAFIQLSKIVSEHAPAFVKKAMAEWKLLLQRENAPTPTARALSVLSPKLPSLILFDESSRDLRSSYSISDLRGDLPDALENLLEVAGLDMPALLAAIDAANGPELTTIEYRANAAIRNRFKEAWQQTEVHVAFRISTETLEIQVVNENTEFTSFAERSDGLRQFVALQAFASCNWTRDPILIIDEAEQKLHYDAQADLVQMLARQNVSQKVIFTTHSAGCLPEDLGYGVRLAKHRIDDPTASSIQNKFWADNNPGFAPLLFGLGASTLAFFPTRKAVLVEGPADMLLAPTMFREALARAPLGFQFVPGLSVTDHSVSPVSLRYENGVQYLVDGDGGGAELKLKLIAKGADEADISVIRNADRSAQELEDFIDPALLLEGANSLINLYYEGTAPIAITDIKSRHRMDSLERAYRDRTSVALPKVDLAYAILDLLNDAPGRAILDPRRKAAFAQIGTKIVERFEVKARNRSRAEP